MSHAPAQGLSQDKPFREPCHRMTLAQGFLPDPLARLGLLPITLPSDDTARARQHYVQMAPIAQVLRPLPQGRPFRAEFPALGPLPQQLDDGLGCWKQVGERPLGIVNANLQMTVVGSANGDRSGKDK